MRRYQHKQGSRFSVNQMSSVQCNREQNITQYFLFLLDHWRSLQLITGILQRSRSRHRHIQSHILYTYNLFIHACEKLFNRLMDLLIHKLLPHATDLTMTSPTLPKLKTVLITICNWLLSQSYTSVSRAKLAPCTILLSGHILENCRDLTLCLSGLSWIYQSGEAKLRQLLSGIWRARKDEVTPKNGATLYISNSSTMHKSNITHRSSHDLKTPFEIKNKVFAVSPSKQKENMRNQINKPYFLLHPD